MFIGLEDGTGTGSKLKISKQNRAQTDAVTSTTAQKAAEEGRLYQIGAGVVNLTSSNESQVLFLKNDGDSDLEISNVTLSSSLASGGAVADNEVFLAQLYVNPTTIDNSSPAPLINNNLGSSQQPEGVFLAGSEGSAVVGGQLGGAAYFEVAKFSRVNLTWVLPKGSSFSISITPPAGNNSMNVGCFVDIYVRDEE